MLEVICVKRHSVVRIVSLLLCSAETSAVSPRFNAPSLFVALLNDMIAAVVAAVGILMLLVTDGVQLCEFLSQFTLKSQAVLLFGLKSTHPGSLL